MRLPPIALSVAALVASGALAAPAHADHDRLPDGRHVKDYTVRSGDTATELAVRFHAWTAELIAHNHLGSTAALRTGQRIEIPVVTSAVRDPKPKPKPAAQQSSTPHTAPDAPRDRVRATIVRAARHRGVDPQLALAVSWQESGWQMGRTSSAGAVGAMQVLPATAEWMEWYVGRELHPRRLRDNVAAGVALLGVLDDHTRTHRHRVGAYYQGLGAVREHGLYDETRHYVDNVVAIRHRLERGQPPG